MNASSFFFAGEFLASKGRYREAAEMYEKSAELKPKDYELAVAAATAMRQAGRHIDAETWYRKAVFLKPSVSIFKIYFSPFVIHAQNIIKFEFFMIPLMRLNVDLTEYKKREIKPNKKGCRDTWLLYKKKSAFT